jgi:uncharacterized membrane protein
MNTYSTLLQIHSIFRYWVLAFVIVALIKALIGWLGQRPYTERNRLVNMFAMISVHIQFTLGVLLYFFSPLVMVGDMGSAMKNATTRYWTVEHAVMMLIAVVLFTIGHVRSKKVAEAIKKHRTVAIFYALGLFIVIFAILQSGRPLIGK